ncbi:hypothetical protein VDIAB_100926 [Vibrio diabolicus]|nr:hypothetical protein VDIAB_100926 [Vibrio diabolicus]
MPVHHSFRVLSSAFVKEVFIADVFTHKVIREWSHQPTK